jgi:circadian clock protein KaiC
VILLDFRTTEQISTRRLRIIKYRGSAHGADEYPFLIEKTGISILPVTSLGLSHTVSNDRISSGIPRLDNMLAGKGFYRGSTILISGTAGTGKTSFAAKFVEAACKRKERCLYLAFEESADQIIRNMKSIGTDLAPWVKKENLKFHASRPSLYGLEMHLLTIHNLIAEFKPQIVIVDPVSNLTTVGSTVEVKSVLTRLFDYLKMSHVTTLLTDLVHAGNSREQTNEEISSLVDTWILLRDIEVNGERNRGLYILKSRGMAHSNQIREVLFSNRGIELVDVYLGPGGVLTGSARVAQEAKETSAASDYERKIVRKIHAQEGKCKAMEVKIEALRADFDLESEELQIMIATEKKKQKNLVAEQAEMARLRKADQATDSRKETKKKDVR